MTALAAGALSKISVQKTGATLNSAAATGGTGPYTYQWYMSTVNGFTPGAGNIVNGATTAGASNQAFTGLQAGTTYYFVVVATDSVAATNASSQLTVITAPDQVQNQFAQTPQLGMPDSKPNWNTIPCVIDSSESGSDAPGQAVKMVTSSSGVPKVVACTAASDNVLGFIVYNPKDIAYAPQDACEVATSHDVLYLISVGAINAGAQVQLDLTYVGGVKAKTGSSGATFVGWAMDAATADGQLIRVRLATPSFTTF